VRCSAVLDAQAGPRERLLLVVEDDGPGISAADRARVGQRGVRADESVPGHGLGLAMVRDTVDLYGGQLAIDTSALGGARFSLHLPGR
jgi:signal transduction histidine kinase